jgi:hypothetical protein
MLKQMLYTVTRVNSLDRGNQPAARAALSFGTRNKSRPTTWFFKSKCRTSFSHEHLKTLSIIGSTKSEPNVEEILSAKQF